MNKFWKKRIFWINMFKVTITLSVVTGGALLMSFVDGKKKDVICKKVNISIDYGNSPKFIFEQKIGADIDLLEGKITGKPANLIRIERIESFLKTNPFVKKADVFTSTDGVMFIDIIQKKAVVRVINSQNQSLYLDEDGSPLPFEFSLPYRLIPVTGNIGFSYENASDTTDREFYAANKMLMHKLVHLANAIRNDAFMEALTEQIYVEDMNHFELIPKLGGHIIALGNTDRLEEKFSNLLAFYNEGIEKIGWENCNEISLKNKNQVVCKIKTKNGI